MCIHTHTILLILQLKPYVSYKTPYVVAKPITAQDILSIVQPLEAAEDATSSSKATPWSFKSVHIIIPLITYTLLNVPASQKVHVMIDWWVMKRKVKSWSYMHSVMISSKFTKFTPWLQWSEEWHTLNALFRESVLVAMACSRSPSLGCRLLDLASWSSLLIVRKQY